MSRPPVTQRMREIAAEHLRRDNERYLATRPNGSPPWTDNVIGQVVTGSRDMAAVVQIVADTCDILGIDP